MNGAPPDEDPALKESENWPLDRRFSHENWRVRSNAFQFVVEQSNLDNGVNRATLENAVCGKSPGLNADRCLQLLASAVADQNANVMEKALDAYRGFVDALGSIVVFVEDGKPDLSFQSSAETCMKRLTAACLKASKRTTLVKSVGVCGALVEVGQGMVVMQGLVEGGFSHKVPKAVATALEAVLGIVLGFYGTGEYDQRSMEEEVKVLLGGISKAKLYSHRDAAVRTHVKDIVVALMGTSKRLEAAVRGMLLEQLPDTMQKEVLDCFSNGGSSGANRGEMRYTKLVQKELAARAADRYPNDVEMMDIDEQGGGNAILRGDIEGAAKAGDGSDHDSEIDPYDFAEPSNIMPSLQKAKIKVGPDEDSVAFWDCFTSKKWNVRKAAVELVRDAALKAVRLDPLQMSDYAALVREFKVILTKDANVHCAATAAMASEAMAKALRVDFATNAKLLCPDVMSRFKEKNPVMSKAAESCLQTFATHCYSLKDVSDDIISALSQKNPKMLTDSLRYLSFLAERESRQSAGSCKDTLSAVVKLLSDADAKVRQEAQNAVVAFAGTMGGLAAIKPYLNGLDDKKKDSIEKIIKERSTGAMKAARKTQRNTGTVKPPAVVKPAGAVPRRPALPAESSASATTRPARPTRPVAPVVMTGESNGVSGAMFSENTVSKESAEEFLVKTFGPELVESLRSSLWQERVESISQIAELADKVLASGDGSLLLLSVSHLPGWTDKNFQVLNKLFEVCTKAAELSKCGDFGPTHASCVVQGSVEKIHELKHRAQASTALTAACKRVGPKYVVALVHQRAAWHKNPKVLAESLVWIQKTIDQFGYDNVDSKGSIVAWMKDDLGSTDPNVKSKALALLGECHSQVGLGPFQTLMDSLKPALVTSLQDTFAKKPVDTTYQPTLSFKSSGHLSGGHGVGQVKVDEISAVDYRGTGDNELHVAPVRELELMVESDEPLVDRLDVSRSLGEELVSQLMSTNWKERNAAVESVEEVIASARHITPDLPSDFLGALRKRFGDSNRNLAARSITLVGTLATAVGPDFDRIAHATLLGPAVENLADMKKQVREAVIGMLDAWGRTCPKDRLFSALFDAVSNPKGASEGKVMALKWMVDNYQPNAKCKELALRAAAAGAKDKTAPVRSAASQLEKIAGGKAASGVADGAGIGRDTKAKILVPTSSATARMAATPARTVASARTPVAKVATKSAIKSTVKQSTDRARPGAGTSSRTPVDDYTNLSLSMGQGKGARSRQYCPKPGGFEPPSASDRARLLDLLSSVASPALHTKMFSRDFQDHVDALEALTEAVSGQINEILTSLDLILHWIVLVLCEQNTQSSMKALDLLRLLLEHLADDGYRLSDMEATILLSAIIEKSGQNQEYMRSAYRNVLVLSASVYNPARVIDMIILGLGTKNSRSKVECCVALSDIVQQNGGRCVANAKNKPVVALSHLVNERDPALRLAATAALESIRDSVDDSHFSKMLSKVKDSHRQIVESKVKAKASNSGISIDVTTEAAVDRHEAHLQPPLNQKPNPNPYPEPMQVDLVSAEPTPAAFTIEAAAKPAAMLSDNIPRVLDMTPESGTTRTSAFEHLKTPSAMSMPAVDAVDAGLVGGALTSAASIHTPVPVELKSTPSKSADNEATGSQYNQQQVYDDREFEQRWERNIELMYSADLAKAVDATKHICSDIMMVTSKDGQPPSPRVLAVLASTADRFVLAVCAQLEVIFNDAARQVAQRNNPPSSRGCKFALNALLQGLGVEDLSMAIPQGTLRMAISLLLCSLVDEHGLLCFEQGTTLVRAVNVLIAKMLDAANKNYAFAALLHLLRSPPTKSLAQDAVPKFNDLVVKCLIKLTKGLDSEGTNVDISFVLLCLHDYFMFLGVEEIRKRSAAEDKPLRMVKTILHQLCKLVGYNIYQYSTGIPGRHAQPQPIIFRYIDINLKMLKEMNQLPADDAAGAGMGASTSMSGVGSVARTAVATNMPSSQHSDDEEVRIKLKDVLSRVTSKDQAMKNVAMRELLDVRRKHPQMVEKYLHATQDRFRTYIEESLKEMAAEGSAMGRRAPGTISGYGNGLGGGCGVVPSATQSNASGGTQGVSSVDDLAERLARLKQRSQNY